MEKVPVKTTLEPDIKAKFEIIAERNDLSSADAMQIAMIDYIQKYETSSKIKPEEVKKMILSDESTTIRKAMIWAQQLYHHSK